MFTLSTSICYNPGMNDYHHGDLRRKLLEEGLKLFSEERFRNFSMRKLAQRCQVSHTSPYRHFTDKEDLIRVLSKEVHEKFNTALREAMDRTEGSPEEKLKGMGRGYVRFFMKNPEFLDLLFLTPEIHGAYGIPEKEEAGTSFLTYLGAVFAAEKRETEIPTDLNMIRGEMLQPWCLIHGLTVLLVKRAIPLTDQEQIDRLIDQVLGTV